MKCTSCNSELKEGARFCTSCGTKIAPAQTAAPVAKGGDVCPECNAPLKENAKFCTSCGFKLAATQAAPSAAKSEAPKDNADTNETKGRDKETFQNLETVTKEDIGAVKQYIFWQIEKGEIARKIDEKEFLQYASARGIIINDGTTAFMRGDGKIIARLSGGNYNFIDPAKLEQIMEEKTSSIFSPHVKEKWRLFCNAVFGTKIKEAIDVSNIDPKKHKSIEQVIAIMRKDDPLMSITLMLDNDFELIFGDAQQSVDDYSNFVPMKIRTKYLDVDFGVRANFRVENSELFARNFLLDSLSASTATVADKLTPIITSAIQKVFSDVEIDNYNIPVELQQKAVEQITKELDECGLGISLQKIISLSVTDEDIERLRTISRELYLSEKELDFLARSNDLKNRMNMQLDEQELFEAQREGVKGRKLLDINKDNLLSQAEYNEFVEKLNFDAQVRAIRSNASLVQEQYDAAKREVAAEHEINKMRGQNESEILDINIEKRKKVDDYNLEKASKEQDLQNRKADSAIDRLRQMKELKRQEEDAAHRREQENERARREHEREMAQQQNDKELSELDKFAQMSGDQLMSVGALRNMDAEGSKAYAEAMGKKFESENKDKLIENLERMNSERSADRDRDNDRLERMMMQMMGAKQSQAEEHHREQEKLRHEYDAKLERQERRVDSTSETALEYATRNNAIRSQSVQRECPQCGEPQDGDAQFCDNCGSRI